MSGRAGKAQDLYALGTTLHRVFAGLSDEEAMTLNDIPALSADVPRPIHGLIAGLRREVPCQRLSAVFAKSAFDRLSR
jgi:hypothetical protein